MDKCKTQGELKELEWRDYQDGISDLGVVLSLGKLVNFYSGRKQRNILSVFEKNKNLSPFPFYYIWFVIYIGIWSLKSRVSFATFQPRTWYSPAGRLFGIVKVSV